MENLESHRTLGATQQGHMQRMRERERQREKERE